MDTKNQLTAVELESTRNILLRRQIPEAICYSYESSYDKMYHADMANEFCECLSRGEKFALVFSHPLDKSREIQFVYPENELSHATVVLRGGQKMRFPLFEAVSGKVFKGMEIRAYWDREWDREREARREGVKRHPAEPAPTSTLAEFEAWMELMFGAQFVGTVEPRGGSTLNRIVAIEYGVALARAQSEVK